MLEKVDNPDTERFVKSPLPEKVPAVMIPEVLTLSVAPTPEAGKFAN